MEADCDGDSDSSSEAESSSASSAESPPADADGVGDFEGDFEGAFGVWDFVGDGESSSDAESCDRNGDCDGDCDGDGDGDADAEALGVAELLELGVAAGSGSSDRPWNFTDTVTTMTDNTMKTAIAERTGVHELSGRGGGLFCPLDTAGFCHSPRGAPPAGPLSAWRRTPPPRPPPR